MSASTPIEMDPDEILDEAIALGEELIGAGADDAATAKSVAGFLDRLLPLDVLIPGPAGMIAEAADGPIFERITAALLDAFRATPEVRAERKARRAAKRQIRQARRAARRA